MYVVAEHTKLLYGGTCQAVCTNHDHLSYQLLFQRGRNFEINVSGSVYVCCVACYNKVLMQTGRGADVNVHSRNRNRTKLTSSVGPRHVPKRP
jgi:hypothetical protein